MLRRKYLLPDDLGVQGFIAYKLSDQTLVLSGGSAQGTFYAAQALLDRLYLERGDLKVEGLHTELFPILNRPAISTRGACTNIGGPDHIGRNAWAQEWQRGDEYDYRGFIDWMARLRMTHLNVWLLELAFGISYPSAKFPECVNPHHPNVKREFLGEMIEYAHSRFMDVSMFIDFPDMFSGILRHHPEPAAKQFDASRLPSDEAWEAYQRTGEGGREHNFRRGFGTVCAFKPETMTFWEDYLGEVFERYPGLDGIMGQFSEGVDKVCACDRCQTGFLEAQWRYFRRMAEVAQRDRPDRRIYNCASPGDVAILRRRDDIRHFTHVDWSTPFLAYERGRARLQGEWHLFHHSGQKWFEFDWKRNSACLARSHGEGIFMRSVSYQPRESDHFAFSTFAWNPDLSAEDFADLYVKKRLRAKDPATSALYADWIRAKGHGRILSELSAWREQGLPYAASRADGNYPRLLNKEVEAVSSALAQAKGSNGLVDEISEAFEAEREELLGLASAPGA